MTSIAPEPGPPNEPPDDPKGTHGIDGFLSRLGKLLADDASRARLKKRARRWIGNLFGLSAMGYAGFLLLVMVSLRWVGEKNLTLAFLLYLPRIAFLIPSGLLLLPAIVFHRWSALTLFTASFAFLLWGMDFRPRAVPSPTASGPGRSLTVLTYNRGEHMNQSLRPFKNRIRPDVIVLQDAGGRAAGYLAAEGYEEFPHALDLAEFTLLSRYPVLGATLVETDGDGKKAPIAARFRIDFEGTEVAIYAVHTVSPRDTLLYYRRGAFLYGLIGVPGTPLAHKRRANQAYWDERITEARILRDQILADPLPALIAGDFNAPAGGHVHGLFRSRFQDAHEKAGHGFGFSFPGTTRNPLSLGGPWIRIDYLFCDEHWKPTWCITEADRPSQHRAVAARFELVR